MINFVASLTKKTFHRTAKILEDVGIAALAPLYQEYYGHNSFVGVVGVTADEDGNFYIQGSVPGAKVEADCENPGAKARKIAKDALSVQLGPLPPDKGAPHKLILIPTPSFVLRTPFKKQWQFLDQWKCRVTAYDLPYCDFTVMR